MAGTLESSDIRVVMEPSEEGIVIELTSTVEKQYGESIRRTISEVLSSLGVTAVRVTANDRVALDCTIRARVETAARRAAERKEGTE